MTTYSPALFRNIVAAELVLFKSYICMYIYASAYMQKFGMAARIGLLGLHLEGVNAMPPVKCKLSSQLPHQSCDSKGFVMIGTKQHRNKL